MVHHPKDKKTGLTSSEINDNLLFISYMLVVPSQNGYKKSFRNGTIGLRNTLK